MNKAKYLENPLNSKEMKGVRLERYLNPEGFDLSDTEGEWNEQYV